MNKNYTDVFDYVGDKIAGAVDWVGEGIVKGVHLVDKILYPEKREGAVPYLEMLAENDAKELKDKMSKMDNEEREKVAKYLKEISEKYNKGEMTFVEAYEELGSYLEGLGLEPTSFFIIDVLNNFYRAGTQEGGAEQSGNAGESGSGNHGSNGNGEAHYREPARDREYRQIAQYSGAS